MDFVFCMDITAQIGSTNPTVRKKNIPVKENVFNPIRI